MTGIISTALLSAAVLLLSHAASAQTGGDITGHIQVYTPTIPAEGGLLRYGGGIQNNTDEAILIRVDILATVPGGGEVRLDRQTVGLPPFTGKGRNLREPVPDYAPSGTYVVRLVVNGTIEIDTFTFEKLPASPAAFAPLARTTADAEWAVLANGATTSTATGVYLSEVSPNPFGSGGATLTIESDADQTVTVVVFDALGRRVTDVLAITLASGQPHRLDIDAAWLEPGVYVVRVTGKDWSETRRATLVR